MKELQCAGQINMPVDTQNELRVGGVRLCLKGTDEDVDET